MLEIPLAEGINKTVETTIEGTSYLFNTHWNSRFGYYSMDISVDKVKVASGIVLASGVDIASIASIPLNRVYCINKNKLNEDLTFSGLGNDGLVVIIEDSDLGV